MMQRLSPTKKRKRNCSEWFEYFGHWTVFICWTESGLCKRVCLLKVDPQRVQVVSPNKNIQKRLELDNSFKELGYKSIVVKSSQTFVKKQRNNVVNFLFFQSQHRTHGRVQISFIFKHLYLCDANGKYFVIFRLQHCIHSQGSKD